MPAQCYVVPIPCYAVIKLGAQDTKSFLYVPVRFIWELPILMGTSMGSKTGTIIFVVRSHWLQGFLPWKRDRNFQGLHAVSSPMRALECTTISAS